MTGSFDLSAGSLGLEAPATLTWSGTLAGVNLQEVDSTDTTFTAVDPTGSGDGWVVSAESTGFTGTDTETSLPTSALQFNGSIETLDGVSPTSECASESTCTNASDTVSDYPVTVSTTEATPIYSADASTGLGAIVIGDGGDPAGWWLTIPANTLADTYTGTVTLSIDSLPPS
jgi:hypothetical protein